MAEAKEMLRRARLIEQGLEKTAKRVGKLPVRLVKRGGPGSSEDAALLEKVDSQLKTLQQAGSALTENLNEVELSLLQLRHAQRLRKQARNNISLAEKRAERVAAERARQERKAAAKAKKAGERAAKQQAKEAKKARRAQKKAADKAARQAKKDADKRARKERQLRKKDRAANPASESGTRPAVLAAGTGASAGSGLLGAAGTN